MQLHNTSKSNIHLFCFFCSPLSVVPFKLKVISNNFTDWTTLHWHNAWQWLEATPYKQFTESSNDGTLSLVYNQMNDVKCFHYQILGNQFLWDFTLTMEKVVQGTGWLIHCGQRFIRRSTQSAFPQQTKEQCWHTSSLSFESETRKCNRMKNVNSSVFLRCARMSCRLKSRSTRLRGRNERVAVRISHNRDQLSLWERLTSCL